MLKILVIWLLVTVLISAPLPSMAGLVGPVQVIDADTWDVGGERVRLFGIDAPEMAQACRDARNETWSCGVWATDRVRARFEGRVVTCERLGPDKYGRTVARCFDDGRDVARDMVVDGLAFAFRRYSSDYVLDEKAAAIRAVGLHAGSVQVPSEFRAGIRAEIRAEIRAQARKARYLPAPDGCRIKGNISRKGTRIFHLPGQQFYDRTRISATKGERWFCSQSQARAAGWRAAFR
jgi:endonuclease YncB( thermonuclease family)